jgi:hypothetical protein
MLRQAEQSRLGIPWLRAWGEGADFDKAKSEGAPGLDGRGRFIHASGEAKGVWKVEAEARNRSLR